MVTVTVNGLDCGVTYTIIAGGTLNGDVCSRTKIISWKYYYWSMSGKYDAYVLHTCTNGHNTL